MGVHRRTRMLELTWRVHRGLFRATRGRVGRRYGGMPIALVTTTGRKSGQPRDVTIPFVRDRERYVFVASNAGDTRDPDWVHNLRARPEATLTVGGRTVPVRGREADGEERDRLWALATEANPDYLEYEQRVTNRRIPVMVLEEPSQ
ncbi:MAG: nitroreductase family deazaflavin-dependent oxidoreductase [Actinomycetota bacterium]